VTERAFDVFAFDPFLAGDFLELLAVRELDDASPSLNRNSSA
jgi:hypothetical protein